MNCDYYSVYENGTCIAQNINLEHALMFVKALLEKYWNESGVPYAIMRQAVCCQETSKADIPI